MVLIVCRGEKVSFFLFIYANKAAYKTLTLTPALFAKITLHTSYLVS